MTTLRTVEEVARPFMGMELDSYDVYSAMRADRLAISTALVEALEGMTVKQSNVNFKVNEHVMDFANNLLNEFKKEAQNIIKELLESKN